MADEILVKQDGPVSEPVAREGGIVQMKGPMPCAISRIAAKASNFLARCPSTGTPWMCSPCLRGLSCDVRNPSMIVI